MRIKKTEIPRGWTLEAADFINKCIERKAVNRLGLNGPQELKQHPWLRDFPWQELHERKLKAPFFPKPTEDNFDKKNIEEDWKDQDSEQMKQNALLLRRNSVQAMFNGYYFDNSIAAIAGAKISFISTMRDSEAPTEVAKKSMQTFNKISPMGVSDFSNTLPLMGKTH